MDLGGPKAPPGPHPGTGTGPVPILFFAERYLDHNIVCRAEWYHNIFFSPPLFLSLDIYISSRKYPYYFIDSYVRASPTQLEEKRAGGAWALRKTGATTYGD